MANDGKSIANEINSTAAEPTTPTLQRDGGCSQVIPPATARPTTPAPAVRLPPRKLGGRAGVRAQKQAS